ncbi:MAG: hypothetical protein ABSH01_00970 [Terriglobia bacterium]
MSLFPFRGLAQTLKSDRLRQPADSYLEETMKGNLIIHNLECPNPCEVLFVRALTPKSVDWLVKKQFDVSRDQHKKSVEEMLKQLGLQHLENKEFVSIYAFTANTWRYLKGKISGMSEGLELAAVLNRAKLTKAGEVWVFNGDIQNLAASPSDTWWRGRYNDDAEKIAKELDCLVASQKIHCQVPEARLYARLTPDLIEHVYCGKQNDPCAMGWARKLENLCLECAQ